MEIMLISLTELISKYKMAINGVIHIGAHYGEELNDYVDNGITKIILFEPLQENYSVLGNKVYSLVGKYSQLEIESFNVALGLEETEATMFVSSNEKQSSSILRPKEHLTHHPNVLFHSYEVVQVKMLDSFDTHNYNFINMDVQGYELEVLKGSRETLKQVDYVYCEVNRAEVYENNAFIEEIDEFLSEYNLTRVETDWAGDIWGDALYVKTNV
jgi:FkbM family methyltransferase